MRCFIQELSVLYEFWLLKLCMNHHFYNIYMQIHIKIFNASNKTNEISIMGIYLESMNGITSYFIQNHHHSTRNELLVIIGGSIVCSLLEFVYLTNFNDPNVSCPMLMLMYQCSGSKS